MKLFYGLMIPLMAIGGVSQGQSIIDLLMTVGIFLAITFVAFISYDKMFPKKAKDKPKT